MNRQHATARSSGRFQRVAAEPFRSRPDRHAILAALRADAPVWARFLAAEGLAPLWHDWIAATDLGAQIAPALLAELAYQRRKAVASYLLQCRTAARACDCLARADIKHALFKGGAVRERLYDNASARPAEDIDILVPCMDRDRALRALSGDGFVFYGSRNSIGHECVLSHGHANIDLHWHLFRSGRSRIDLVPRLLRTARVVGPFSVLGDSANLLAMLVHPAFVKHVNGRDSKLVRAVDLDRMLRLTDPDWDWILPLIDAAGLRVAAWAMLYWTRGLMDTPVEPAVLRHLEPGRLQRRYLAYWIDRRLPSRLGGIPGLVQGAFTLVLHERPGDAWRALTHLARARRESGAILRRLNALAAASAGARP